MRLQLEILRYRAIPWMWYGHPQIISQLTQIIIGLEKNNIQFHKDSMYKYMLKKKLTENNTDRPKSEET